jgi:hypothetical protein
MKRLSKAKVNYRKHERKQMSRYSRAGQHTDSGGRRVFQDDLLPEPGLVFGGLTRLHII